VQRNRHGASLSRFDSHSLETLEFPNWTRGAACSLMNIELHDLIAIALT
jgi:hypothetical protein